MSHSVAQSEFNRTLFQKGVFAALLIAALGIPLCVTTIIDNGEDKWFLIRTVGPLLGVLLLIQQSGKPIDSRPLDGLAVFALAWIAIQAISMIGSANIGVSLAGLTRQIGLVSFFFLARFFAADHKALLKIMYALLLLGLTTSIYGIAQHFGYDFIQWQVHSEIPIERGVSFMGHATFAASVLIMVIPLAVTLAISTKKRPLKSGLVFIALVMLYHLSFTGARVATVALFLSAAVAVVAYMVVAKVGSSHSESQPTPARSKATILFVLAIALAGSFFIYRAWSLKNSDVLGLLEGGLAQRIYAWETANRIFIAHPVNGIGIGNYEVVSPAYWNIVEANRFTQLQRSLYQPHNEYIEAAAETGLPGIAAVLGIIVFALAQCITRTRLPRVLAVGLFSAVLASALDAFFLFPWQVPESALVFWLLLGSISGQYTHKPETQPTIEELEPKTA